MSSIETNLENIVPGKYHFDVAFFAGASTVGSASGVEQVVADKLRIPEDHTLYVADGAHVQPRTVRYTADATFTPPEGSETLVAPIRIEVNEPGLVARAAARLRGREPNAVVIATAHGANPFNGGSPAAPNPDIPPLPVSPMGGILFSM